MRTALRRARLANAAATGGGAEQLWNNIMAIPLFITNDLRERLKKSGYTDVEIDAMKPADAWAKLGGVPVESDFRDVARQYVKWGLSPIPLRARDKRPLRAWEEFQKRVVTEAEISAWQWPNIGIVTGAISGVIVLDTDGAEGEETIKQHDALQTPTVKTAKGRHLYFKHPGGRVSNFTRKLPGLDLRGDGGYVVAPPSIHPSGVVYEWIILPDDCEFADPPQWLLELITAQNELLDHISQIGKLPTSRVSYGQAALASELSALLRSPNGQRNDSLNKAAYALGQLVASGDLDKTDVERHLYDAAITLGLDRDPGCGIDGIWKTIRSGLGAGMKKPRQIKLLPKAQPGAIPSFLLTEDASDEGNARCVFHIYGNMFLYNSALGWQTFNGTHWQAENAEARLDRCIIEVLQARRAEAVKFNREQIIAATKPSARHVTDCKKNFYSLVTASVSEFDADPNLLNCVNGVIDLRTGQLLPHIASQRFTYCVPVEYDPATDWTEWENFLYDVSGRSQEVLEYIQMAVGYSLTGYTSEECLFYIHGPTRAGKGTFTETLLALLPKPLAVETDFNTFTRQRDDANNFDLAPLRPARLVIASESNKYQTLNSGKVKALTGGNEVYCAFKHRTHFSYRPQYKVWLVSNHPVNADVDDDAIWYRVRVIEFPTSFAGYEDKALKARMKLPDNLKAVLAWAVAGAVKWFCSPVGLTTPEVIQSITYRHRSDLDYVQTWLDECCEVSPARWTANDEIYKSYSDWCKENGVEPKQQRSLSQSLQNKGFLIGQQKKNSFGQNKKGVIGLRIK